MNSCDHKDCNEVVINYIEFKCAGCGQIKKKVRLEECLLAKDKIVMT